MTGPAEALGLPAEPTGPTTPITRDTAIDAATQAWAEVVVELGLDIPEEGQRQELPHSA